MIVLTRCVYEAVVQVKSEKRIRQFAEEELEYTCYVVNVGEVFLGVEIKIVDVCSTTYQPM